MTESDAAVDPALDLVQLTKDPARRKQLLAALTLAGCQFESYEAYDSIFWRVHYKGHTHRSFGSLNSALVFMDGKLRKGLL